MSEGWIHDFVALMHQQALAQTQDMELNLTGRVIEYDPASGMARVLIETRGTEDEPMETGWCQVGTMQSGGDGGDQYCLKGGATRDNTEGEPVSLSLQNRQSGLAVVATLLFDDNNKAPGAGPNGDAGNDSDDNAQNDTDGTLQLRAQERIIKVPAGAFVKFYSNGDMQISSERDLYVRIQNNGNIIVEDGDFNVTVDTGNIDLESVTGTATLQGDRSANLSSAAQTNIGAPVVSIEGATVDVAGTATINIDAPEVNVGLPGTYLWLLTTAFLAAFNAHTHPTPMGESGTPTVAVPQTTPFCTQSLAAN